MHSATLVALVPGSVGCLASCDGAPSAIQLAVSVSKMGIALAQHARRSFGFFVNGFTSAPFAWAETHGFLQTNHTKPPPEAGFGGTVRPDLALSPKKTCLFVRFFAYSQKYQKWRHFRQYQRFSGMFEQAEPRGIPMGPHGPPNAKGTAQIAPEIAILENQAIWVILIIIFW